MRLGLAAGLSIAALAVGCSALIDFDRLRDGTAPNPDLAGVDGHSPVDFAGIDLAGADLMGGCQPGVTNFAKTARLAFDNGKSPFAIGVGRFNADTRDDLAVLNSGDGSVAVWLGAAKGASLPLTAKPAPPTCPAFGADPAAPVDLLVADVDNNGDPDVVLLCAGSDAGVDKAFVQPLHSDGTGVFTLFSKSAAVHAASSARFAAGHFASNTNGAIDLAVATYLGSPDPGAYPFYGDGTGLFTVGPGLPSMDSPYLAKAGRITTGDTYDDLLLFYYNEAYVVRNTSGAWTGSMPAIAPLTRMPYGPTVNVNDAAIADVDNDGRNDVIWMSDRQITTYLNVVGTQWPASGDGSSSTTAVDTSTSAVSFQGNHLVAGDLDCDGRADLAVVGYNASAQVVVRIFVASANPDSKGSFDAVGQEIALGTLSTAGTVALADLDGDGDLDIVATGWDGAQTGEAYVIDNLAVP